MTQDPEKATLEPFQRHVFICTGSKCAPEVSGELYKNFRDKLREINPGLGDRRILRSQCRCFGICKGGPLVAVYPDNVWYDAVTPEKMDRILKEHLIEGRPVKEYCFFPPEKKA